MGGDLSCVALHADSLEKVAGHGWYGADVLCERPEGGDFVIDGFEEGESLFWGH